MKSSTSIKVGPGDIETVGRWSLDKARLRRSLKTLAVIPKDDHLHHFADELMLQTLGIMTLVWAVMERSMDDIVEVVFGRDTGDAIQSTLPVTLDNKLDYLKMARAKLPWLAPFVPQMRNLQTRIKLARAHRKNVTHGILEVAGDDPHVWRAKVLHFKGGNSAETVVSYGAAPLFKTIREIDAIALDLQTLLDDLQTSSKAADAPQLKD